MIRVTVEDTETGETEVKEIENDYVVVTAWPCYVAHVQEYPKTGTAQLTIKRAGRQESTALPRVGSQEWNDALVPPRRRDGR